MRDIKFKIKCECGKETDIDKAISVYEWTIDIVCECGNKLGKWYDEEVE